MKELLFVLSTINSLVRNSLKKFNVPADFLTNCILRDIFLYILSVSVSSAFIIHLSIISISRLFTFLISSLSSSSLSNVENVRSRSNLR